MLREDQFIIKRDAWSLHQFAVQVNVHWLANSVQFRKMLLESQTNCLALVSLDLDFKLQLKNESNVLVRHIV